MKVRPAEPADSKAIGAIYNFHVETTTTTVDLIARTDDEQLRWLQDRSGGLAVLVAESDREITGFASLSFYRDRPGYRTSVENSIYVSDEHQGQGVGSALLTELVDVAKTHGFHAMFARIVDLNEASMALHRQCGFELVGVEREVARKFGRWHDVALMQRLL